MNKRAKTQMMKKNHKCIGASTIQFSVQKSYKFYY